MVANTEYLYDVILTLSAVFLTVKRISVSALIALMLWFELQCMAVMSCVAWSNEKI